MNSRDDQGREIAFTELDRSAFPLLQKWLAAPHVAIWWNERFDPASLEVTYGPRIDRLVPIHTYIIHCESVPIGWIQWYRWRDFPEHGAQLGAGVSAAGIDLAIGEAAWTGRGLGPVIIREFAKRFVFAAGMDAIVADPAADNSPSLSAFRKAGFTIIGAVRLSGEDFTRHVVRLDRAGSRVAEPVKS